MTDAHFHKDDALSASAHASTPLAGVRRSPRSLRDVELQSFDESRDPVFVQLATERPSPSLAASVRSLCSETIGHAGRRSWRALRSMLSSSSSSSSSKEERQRTTSIVAKCKANTTFYLQHPVVLQREVLCGVAATLLQIPETVAFSYVANLDPLAGLYATGFFGVIVGLFGGVPSTVAGAAGALAVVMPQLTSSTGALAALTYEQRVQHLVVAVFLAGVLQLAFGVLELSRFFSLIPRTAHMGFLNGLAIMMFLSQKTTFQECDASARRDGLRFGECEKQGRLEWKALHDPTLWTTTALVAVTALVMHFFPRVPRVGRLLPPTLVVAVLSVGLEFGVNRPLLGYNVRTIGETSPLAGSLPSLRLPHFADVRDWAAVLSCATSLAAVGIFESIMTIQAVVDLTKHRRLTRRVCRHECVAQGIGNVVCGVFGAMGGCSMIGQSTGNVLNGARHRLSAVVCGLSTFAVLLFASPVMERVPVACLTGILLVIIAHTFHWPSLRLVWRLRATDAVALVLVTALAAAVNLAVAVVAGVVWQSLVNAWTSGQQLRVSAATWETVEVESELLAERVVTARVLRVHGPLQFSSIVAFRNAMEAVESSSDASVVVLDLADAHIADFSAAAALKELALRCADAQQTLVLRHVDAQAVQLVLDHDVGWELTGPHVVLRQRHRSVELGDEDTEAAVATPRTTSSAGPFHAM